MAQSDRQDRGQLDFDFNSDYRTGWRLVELGPEEIGEADLEWLAIAFQESLVGDTLDGQIEDVLTGRAKIYRVVGNGRGAIMTKLVEHPQGRELVLWAMAGERMLAGLASIRDILVEEARRLGARWFGTYSAKPGMIRSAERVGLVRAETHCWMEVNRAG